MNLFSLRVNSVTNPKMFSEILYRYNDWDSPKTLKRQMTYIIFVVTDSPRCWVPIERWTFRTTGVSNKILLTVFTWRNRFFGFGEYYIFYSRSSHATKERGWVYPNILCVVLRSEPSRCSLLYRRHSYTYTLRI